MSSSVLAALLAAGLGSRFASGLSSAGHKLTADLNGEPVIAHSLRAMTASGLPTAVVTGAEDLSAVLAAFPETTEIHNPDFATGQRSSVLCAIAHARMLGCDAVVIGLGDQPFVGADAWVRVASTPGRIVVATDAEGRRGNPVKLAADTWAEFENLANPDPDSGARGLIALHPDWVVQVACEGSFADIDTVDDLTRHNKS